MYNVIILNEGYARYEGDLLLAAPATCIVSDGSFNMLIDPGSNPELLLDSLRAHSVDLSSIHMIFLTHHHPDHMLNIRLFPLSVPVCDGVSLYYRDQIREYTGCIPGTGLFPLPTPGHCHEHWGLIIASEKCRTAIAGDAIWWMDGEEPTLDIQGILSLVDPYAVNPVALKQSREYLVLNSDFIIPGHGTPFHVAR